MENVKELEFMVVFGLEPVFLAEELELRDFSMLVPNGFQVFLRGLCAIEDEDGSADLFIFARVPYFWIDKAEWVLAKKYLSPGTIITLIDNIFTGKIDYLCKAETC